MVRWASWSSCTRRGRMATRCRTCRHRCRPSARPWPTWSGRIGWGWRSWSSWPARLWPTLSGIYHELHELQTVLYCVSPSIKQVRWIFRVGRDTINTSQDLKMKSEMPKSLAAIEKASDFLMEASSSLKSDPYSQVNLILKTKVSSTSVGGWK